MAKYRKKHYKKQKKRNNKIFLNAVMPLLIGYMVYRYLNNVLIGLAIPVTIWSIPFIMRRRTYHRYMNSTIHAVDNMSGEEFEEYLQAHFKSKGYHVEHVGQKGDFGADLILGRGNDKIIVQAKRYSSNVGVAAVQQVISAKEYYGGSHAMVVTNSHFTSAAKQMADRCAVELWDRDTLKKVFGD